MARFCPHTSAHRRMRWKGKARERGLLRSFAATMPRKAGKAVGIYVVVLRIINNVLNRPSAHKAGNIKGLGFDLP